MRTEAALCPCCVCVPEYKEYAAAVVMMTQLFLPPLPRPDLLLLLCMLAIGYCRTSLVAESPRVAIVDCGQVVS